jgi:hypothetical protein
MIWPHFISITHPRNQDNLRAICSASSSATTSARTSCADHAVLGTLEPSGMPLLSYYLAG